MSQAASSASNYLGGDVHNNYHTGASQGVSGPTAYILAGLAVVLLLGVFWFNSRK